jgi:HPt (histidine-containing phosphotransfer) domain-containing protein
MTSTGAVDRSVLDALLESMGGDQEFLRELLDTFFEDAPQLITAMQAAVAAGDAEELRRAAHSLKSTSATFGAMDLSGQCKVLEMMAKSGALQSADAQITAVATEYEQARTELETVQRGS